MSNLAALCDQADANLESLKKNPYPGRGIILGRNSFGDYVIVYWIMGRSEGSRNRIFRLSGERLFTDYANPSQSAGDPKLTLYNAMARIGRSFIVSNGAQTDTIAETIGRRGKLEDGLQGHWKYEPDPPNFTPRISGVLQPRDRRVEWIAELAILKRAEDDRCNSNYYRYMQLDHAMGYCVTTYKGDGNPLPSFEGEPYLVPLGGDAEMIRDTYWQTLDAENRVALAVKVIDQETLESQTLLVNKYEKVAA